MQVPVPQVINKANSATITTLVILYVVKGVWRLELSRIDIFKVRISILLLTSINRQNRHFNTFVHGSRHEIRTKEDTIAVPHIFLLAHWISRWIEYQGHNVHHLCGNGRGLPEYALISVIMVLLLISSGFEVSMASFYGPFMPSRRSNSCCTELSKGPQHLIM